jgi:cytidylate kinase
MSRNIPIVLCGQKGSGCSEVANNLRIKSENSKILNEEELLRLTAARLGISFSDLFRGLKKGSIEYDKTLMDTLHEYTDAKTIIEGKYACRAIDKPSYRIFLTASDNQRIQHISEKWKIPYQQAHEKMKKSDKKRGKIVRQISGREWLDSSLYDLTLDTDNTTFGQISDTILHFIRSTDKKVVNLEDKKNNPQLLSYFHINKLKKYLRKLFN